MKRLLYILIVPMLLASCTEVFDQINTNPNEPEDVDAQFLLANVIKTAADNNSFEGWENGNLLAQLMTKHDFNDVDRYDIKTNTEFWVASYSRLYDLQQIIDQVDSTGNNPRYKAIAMVLKAYVLSQITDLWGDVPYSQALQGAEGSFSPLYDSQESIYMGENGIIATLNTAEQLLMETRDDVGLGPIGGDILFNGDLNKWIMFANSLKLRYWLRVSNQMTDSTMQANLQPIVDTAMLMMSNFDNAILPYLSSAPNQWYVSNVRLGDFENVRFSETLDSVLSESLTYVEGMDTLPDPRLFVFAQPTAETKGTDNPEYIGLPNGLNQASKQAFDLNKISTPGQRFREPDGVDAIFMLFGETQFILAEAALKGWIMGDASVYYQAGIMASFEYLEIEMPTTYLASEGVVLTGVDSVDLDRILTQKWISSFLNGYEGWLDFRRTGLPALRPSVDNLNDDRIPVRYIYPTDEQAVNKSSYDAAVLLMDEGDSYNTKGWWERKE